MPCPVPPTSFYFSVRFLGIGTEDDQCFQEVSGLKVELEVEEVKEGGENRFVHKLPKRTKYPNLVLKRGMLLDTALVKWMEDCFNNYFVAIGNMSLKTTVDIVISLLNDAGTPIATWNVVGAIPVKWEYSGFKGQQNELVFENIELSYRMFTRIL
jgi:phage tail-like protein